MKLIEGMDLGKLVRPRGPLLVDDRMPLRSAVILSRDDLPDPQKPSAIPNEDRMGRIEGRLGGTENEKALRFHVD